MILILCNSFEEAQEDYDYFLSFLYEYEPWHIRRTYNASYCVETDDDLRYIFMDYRFEFLLDKLDIPDKIWADEFFEGIEEYYFSSGGDK